MKGKKRESKRVKGRHAKWVIYVIPIRRPSAVARSFCSVSNHDVRFSRSTGKNVQIPPEPS